MQDNLFLFPSKRSSIGAVVWILAFIIPFCLGTFAFLYFGLLKKKIRVLTLDQEALLEGAIASGLTLLNYLFALLLVFGYRSYSDPTAFWFFLGVDAFILYLSPRKIVLSIKANHHFPRLSRVEQIRNGLLLAILVLELFIFNRNAFTSANFVFSPLRYFGLSLLFIFGFKIPEMIKNHTQSPAKSKWNPYWSLGIGVTIALLVFIVYASLNSSSYFTTYPFQESDKNSNPFLYYNLFQAFKEGHLYLDDVPDPKLATLANPYDYWQRKNAGVSYLWDTAYYDGHYYCYFGPAPVLLVMFPVYWLTGMVPTGLFLEVVAMIADTAGLIYVALRLRELSGNRLPWPMWTFLVVVAWFSSLTLNFIAYRLTDWKYVLPFAYGLTFALWFFGMALTAYSRSQLRMLYLGLAGFFFVALVASRPDLAVVLLFSAPLFLKIFFLKDKTVGKRFLDFVPMLVILLAGAGLLISYNVLRYGKVLEFGQDYQLTALDPSAQGFCPKGILGAFAHYWFALPNAQSDFPYFTTKIWKTNVDTHPYDVGAIGLLVNPFFWGVGLLPFAIKYAKGWEQKTMYVLLPFAAIITSISIYCLGGTCPRYTMGIWPLASLASLAILIKVLSDWDRVRLAKLISYPLLTAGSLFAIVLCFSIAFNSFNGLQLGTHGLFYEWVNSAFSF
jgi:hypothetical protein